jgi:hypothetical protein
LIFSLFAVETGNAQNIVKIRFDSNKEVSGRKFSIGDISKGIPQNWDGYNFVVIEFKSSTSQRFHLGFTNGKKHGYKANG